MKIAGLLLALVLAAGVFLLANDYMGDDSSRPQARRQDGLVTQPEPVVKQPPTSEVLIAREPLAIGSVVTSEHLDTRQWPAHLVLPDFVVVSKDAGAETSIIGRVVRSAFQQGEPISTNKLSNPNDPSFLANWLPEGMRAVTISSNAITSVGGFVFPGDRVDVLMTHSIREGEDGAPEPGQGDGVQITEVLLSDVKVLATDQSVTVSKDEKGIPVPSSVTLEVSREDAQKLRLGATTRALSLALRPLQENEPDTDIPPEPTLEADLTKLLGDSSELGSKRKQKIVIYNGTEREEMMLGQ